MSGFQVLVGGGKGEWLLLGTGFLSGVRNCSGIKQWWVVAQLYKYVKRLQIYYNIDLYTVKG